MDFFRNHKKGVLIVITFFLLSVSAFTLLYNTNATFAENVVSYVIIPVQKTFNNVGNFFSGKVNTFTNFQKIETENEELKNEVAALKEENMKLSLYAKENERLSALLEIDQRYSDYPKTGAQIIAKDPGNWYNKFIIDKGSDHGVVSNMLVLAPEGLIGYTAKCGKKYAQVVSILDDTSALSVMNTRTEDIGVLRGDYGAGLCRVEYINADAEIVEGDEIVTSHLSGYPAGIKIGYVKEVRTDVNGLTKYAIVLPEVNFKKLDTVLVITQAFVDAEQALEE